MLGMVQGYLLHFNQKPPLVKPLQKYEVKIPKDQESVMSSEINTMLLKSTIDLCPGNKGLFTYPFIIPMKNRKSCCIMNLEPLNQFITGTKFKMTT